jgi:hypothetical protein
MPVYKRFVRVTRFRELLKQMEKKLLPEYLMMKNT